MTLLNDHDGSNKTNNENASLPIDLEKNNEMVNVTRNETTKLCAEADSENSIDIKCNCSIFLNDDLVDEIYKIEKILDSELQAPSILTPPRSDEDSSSRYSNDEGDTDELNSSRCSSTSSDNELRTPNFLSLVSVNRELVKLNYNTEENLSDIVSSNPLNLQSNETNTRLDDLMLLNDTWVNNYLANEVMANTGETNHGEAQVYALSSDQLNTQIDYINNNQSLQIMNSNESDRFDYLLDFSKTNTRQSQQQFIVDDAITGSEQNSLQANLTSIDNFLLDENFLKNIEENIQVYETKNQNSNENDILNFGNFFLHYFFFGLY